MRGECCCATMQRSLLSADSPGTWVSDQRKEPSGRTYGWESSFSEFRHASPRVVRTALTDFVRDASPEQQRAWRDSIPWLQTEVDEVLTRDGSAPTYTAVLEYQLPLDSRRPDAVFLVPGAIVVVELKGKTGPSRADLDQVAAYARDLRCYHKHCQDRPVHAVLVPTRRREAPEVVDGIHVAAPADLDGVVSRLYDGPPPPPVDPRAFLDATAYRPLPSLVTAARELFESHEVRDVWRARASTDPAVDTISRIAHEAARIVAENDDVPAIVGRIEAVLPPGVEHVQAIGRMPHALWFYDRAGIVVPAARFEREGEPASRYVLIWSEPGPAPQWASLPTEPVARIPYEDDDFLAFLDINPHAPGHVQVIPKEHYRWVWDLPAERQVSPNVGTYFEVARKVALAQRKAFDTEWILSKIVGDEVPHAHIWVFPGDAEGDESDLEGNARKIRDALA